VSARERCSTIVAEGRACARAALAGNPSDGYGGAVLAVELPALVARVVAVRGSGRIDPASDLVGATVARFARVLAPGSEAADVAWSTTIPLTVGLGGSSAIVIATLRALSALTGITLEPAALAAFALAVEVEDLGIAAGLQDRVVQVLGGLVFMDFRPERPRYEPLDSGSLPPLVIACREESGGESGVVHGDLRARFEAGDPSVRAGIGSLARSAREARAALLSGDRAGFGRCVDLSFDARLQMLRLDPHHVEMIECARAAGACANYTGSGGAIVAVCGEDPHRQHVAAALGALPCRVLAP
jgi:glucuronokinase